MIQFAIREMFESIRTGKMRTLMSVTTISIAMLIFTIFLLITHNLNLGIDRFRATTRMDVILSEDADPARLSALISNLEGVAGVKVYSKSDALRYFREAHGDAMARGITEALGSNPFFAFIEVKLAGRNDDPSELAARIERMDGVTEVLYGRDTVRRLKAVAETARTATTAAGIVMSLFILLIVLNGIRATIHARSEELYILRLIGADDGWIRSPFVLEGIALCLAGALAGLAVMYGAFVEIRDRISFLPIEFLPAELAAAAVIFAAALGALGGIIAVREALDAEENDF